jgi:hypothetical protein
VVLVVEIIRVSYSMYGGDVKLLSSVVKLYSFQEYRLNALTAHNRQYNYSLLITRESQMKTLNL